jgi:hypothetical protein
MREKAHAREKKFKLEKWLMKKKKKKKEIKVFQIKFLV